MCVNTFTNLTNPKIVISVIRAPPSHVYMQPLCSGPPRPSGPPAAAPVAPLWHPPAAPHSMALLWWSL